MKDLTKTDNQPVNAKAALLLIDVISDFEFEDGEKLFKQMLPAARKLVKLREKAQAAQIPVIYVNDNYGKWQEDFNQTVEYLRQHKTRGSQIAELLRPAKDDYYVLKPKHSAFYATALDLLLAELKVETLILAGISTDICVLFTANDAYMRGYKIIVASDCVASVKPQEKHHALNYMERVLKAQILSANEIDFSKLE